MHSNWYTRIFIGLCCAVLLGFVTAVVTEARPAEQAVEIPGDDCQSCHEPITTMWDNGIHSHVTITQGSDTSMTCQTCHPSDPAEHPQKLMYTDTSARLCGNCHVSTFDELEISAHAEEGMSCIRCHNPHDNSLLAGGIQDTCQQCHREETHFYSFTDHAAEGLLCTDCHLQVEEGAFGESHRRHTFMVGMETCAECHADQMHFPTGGGNATTTDEAALVEAMYLSGEENTANVQTTTILSSLGDSDLANLNNEPTSTSTVNLIVMAVIIGMLFGLIGSPWLEKWFNHVRENEEKS